ncbi:hypothetical protein ADU80_06605 [Clostridium botulinum]|uniref:ABC-2 transporter permease n=1 Tax=Clostridium botulinum TaxID=1491 RepID=A0A9Q1ZB81_CLOBO|nr:ABC-2 transporter permease [Clostridium botulinum]KEI01047.1 hypothetical protein Z953_09310 [Clostridium botulinum D str. 16868]KEI04772.1 hypothetical protein Y848_12735 [Clostridium botulinum C/D str. Sp77]KOA78237.1 hypothetical protein ADU77_06280 [Clostridium botulinum]KOA83296.1 hypothetical protein ADU74_12510 [Clostridium botulinum]KOA85696.1 hypothetical protein ADU80_06605 [Clostridium botulinum]
MFNLIMKDMRNVYTKKSIMFYIFYEVILFLAFSDNYNIQGLNKMFVIGSFLAISGLISAFIQDEKNKCEIIINSLPLNRNKIIFARYLSVFVHIVAILVILMIFPIICRTFNFINIYFFSMQDIKGVLKMISIVLVFTSIILPVYFKFGITNVKAINIIFSMCFFGVMGGIGIIYSSADIISMYQLQIFVLIALVVFIVSSLISVKIYSNKDIG